MTDRLDGTSQSVAPILLAEWLRRTGPDAARVHELGWLLGLIGHGLGVEVLGERRERAGLRPLVRLLDDALEHAGKPRTIGPPTLPDVGTAADRGPEAAWLVAELLWTAAGPRTSALPWSFARADGGTCMLATGAVDAATAELLREHAQSLPGIGIEITEEGWQARFPGAMLLPT